MTDFLNDDAAPEVDVATETDDERAARFERDALPYLDQLYAGGAFEGLSEGPDGMKSNLIRSIVMSAREAAQAQLMAENLELRDRIIERKQERARVLDQGGKLKR